MDDCLEKINITSFLKNISLTAFQYNLIEGFLIFFAMLVDSFICSVLKKYFKMFDLETFFCICFVTITIFGFSLLIDTKEIILRVSWIKYIIMTISIGVMITSINSKTQLISQSNIEILCESIFVIILLFILGIIDSNIFSNIKVVTLIIAGFIIFFECIFWILKIDMPNSNRILNLSVDILLNLFIGYLWIGLDSDMYRNQKYTLNLAIRNSIKIYLFLLAISFWN